MTTGDPSGVRLSELLGVLSFGADLGMGQPMEHMLRQCLIALGLAERIGLGDEDREALFFASLVAWVGCHVDAYEQANWFGDEMALKSDFCGVDFANSTSGRCSCCATLAGECRCVSARGWFHRLSVKRDGPPNRCWKITGAPRMI